MSVGTDDPRVDVAEAKSALRVWGVEADESLQAEIRAVREQVASAGAQVKKLTPWVAGVAAVAGLVLGRGGRGESRGGGSSLGAVLRVGMKVAPIVIGAMAAKKRRGAEG